MELNPENKTTAAARDYWHTIVALLLIKLGLSEIRITKADIDKMAALLEVPTIMIHDHAAGLDLKLITRAEAAMLLEREQKGVSQ